MEIRVYDAIEKVPQPAWDALADGEATPFLRWHWLEALETSGCATGAIGWQPCHLTLWRGAELMTTAPAYIKEDSDGDFSRDWGWADAAMRARIRYYPKLVLTVPFTPRVAGVLLNVISAWEETVSVRAAVSRPTTITAFWSTVKRCGAVDTR